MSEEPKKKESPSYGSGSGASTLYAVEARTISSRICKIAGQILTNKWERIIFPTGGTVGVPISTLNPIKESWLHLYSYEAAMALAHWFLAMPDEDLSRPDCLVHALCAEARIIKVDVKYSYSTEEIGVGNPISVSGRTGEFKPRE